MEEITFRGPLQILGMQVLTDFRGGVNTPAASHLEGLGYTGRPGERPAILAGFSSVVPGIC
jgi:hypothetical protein